GIGPGSIAGPVDFGAPVGPQSGPGGAGPVEVGEVRLMGSFAVILPAAGRSTRFGNPKEKKVYAELDGRAVWLRAVEPFVNREDVAQILVVIAPEDRELFERRFRPSVAFMNITVVEGGAERSDSVLNALEAILPVCEYVAIH